MNSEIYYQLTDTLRKGGIAVVRTDTLYGIIALANNKSAVEKVFTAKQRDPNKQCIVLITDPIEVPAYATYIEAHSKETLPTSVIVPASTEPEWLLRGGDSMAYRVVRDEFLKQVVAEVGPVIAPSANPEGLPPARTIDEAKLYFGDIVDCYVNGGVVPKEVQASRIIQVNGDGTVAQLR